MIILDKKAKSKNYDIPQQRKHSAEQRHCEAHCLSSNPTGRYIWFNCAIEEEDDAYSDSLITLMDGNEQVIRICAVGLNDENQIVITDADDDFTWFTPDEWTHAYLEMYEFVLNNLKFAKDIKTDTYKEHIKQFGNAMIIPGESIYAPDGINAIAKLVRGVIDDYLK